MDAKKELLQALLNTSSISNEAFELLSGILDSNNGSSGTVIEECIVNGLEAISTRTAEEIYNDFAGGKRILFYIKNKGNFSSSDENYIELLTFTKISEEEYNIQVQLDPTTYITSCIIADGYVRFASED